MADVKEPDSPIIASSGEDVPSAPKEAQPVIAAEKPEAKEPTTSKDDTGVPAAASNVSFQADSAEDADAKSPKAKSNDGDVPAVTKTTPPVDAEDNTPEVKTPSKVDDLSVASKKIPPADTGVLGEDTKTNQVDPSGLGPFDTSADVTVSKKPEMNSSDDDDTTISTGRKVADDIDLEPPMKAEVFTEYSSARNDVYGKDGFGSDNELWTSPTKTSWSSSSRNEEDHETEKTGFCDVFNCDDCTLHKNKQVIDSLPLSLASEAPQDGEKSPCSVCQRPGCGVCTVFKDVNRWSGKIGPDYGQRSRQVKFGDYGYETGGSSSSSYRTGGWSESAGYKGSSKRGYTIETVETITSSNWNESQSNASEKDKTSAYPDTIRESEYRSSSYTTEAAPAAKSYSGGDWSISQTRDTDFRERSRYGEDFTTSRTGYEETGYGASPSLSRDFDPTPSITRSSAPTTSKPYVSEPYVGHVGTERYDLPVSAVTRPYASYSGSPLIPRRATTSFYEPSSPRVGQPLRYEAATPRSQCHVCEDHDKHMKQHCKICHIPGCRYESSTPSLHPVVSASSSRPLWPSLLAPSYESSIPTRRDLDSLLKQPHCRICHIPGCRYESCEPELMKRCKICHLPECRYECSQTDLAGLAAIGPAAASAPIRHEYLTTPESILLKYAGTHSCGICEPELMKHCKICHKPGCRYDCSNTDLAGLAAIRSGASPLAFRSEVTYPSLTPSKYGSASPQATGIGRPIAQLGTPTYEFNKHNSSPSLSKSALDYRPSADTIRSQPYLSTATTPPKTTSYGDDFDDSNDIAPEYNKRYHAFSARYYDLTAGDSGAEL